MSAAIELIMQIERDLVELSKEYTLFFSDISKVEPYELREAMMAKVKRLRSMNHRRTEEQFRSSNLIAKVQSRVQLWDRQLERKYYGSPQTRRPKKAAPPKPEPKREQKKQPVVINDPKSQRDQVVALYDEYTRLNVLMGSRKAINFAKFQNFIARQTEKVQSAGKVKNVAYELEVRDQKVVVKAKVVRDG